MEKETIVTSIANFTVKTGELNQEMNIYSEKNSNTQRKIVVGVENKKVGKVIQFGILLKKCLI